jgi:hypothetical protein
MMKVLITLGILITLLLPSVAVHAQSAKDAACAGIGATAGATGCDAPTGTPDINHTIATVVNILSVAVGVVAVIMIIVAGLKFITAAGDSNNISSARNTILYAVVGLVVVALAQVIVHFVLNRIPS